MRIYISVDLEGIYGVDRYDLHKDEDVLYQKWKEEVAVLMKEEVLQVYEGLIEKGIDEIIIFDHHGYSDTLELPTNLPKLKQIFRNETGNLLFPALSSKVSGLILWGYHVKSGSVEGKLNHTVSRRIKYIKINDREVGEVYLYGLYAHYFGIPIIAISGDTALHKEIKNDFGNISFFNSNSGKNKERKLYLNSIKKFILDLDIDQNIKINKQLNWPASTKMEVAYKNPIINIARWVLRRQYKFSKLKSLSSCIYDKSNFKSQFDNFNGYL